MTYLAIISQTAYNSLFLPCQTFRVRLGLLFLAFQPFLGSTGNQLILIRTRYEGQLIVKHAQTTKFSRIIQSKLNSPSMKKNKTTLVLDKYCENSCGERSSIVFMHVRFDHTDKVTLLDKQVLLGEHYHPKWCDVF